MAQVTGDKCPLHIWQFAPGTLKQGVTSRQEPRTTLRERDQAILFKTTHKVRLAPVNPAESIHVRQQAADQKGPIRGGACLKLLNLRVRALSDDQVRDQ
jgi:hypothetical protein